MKHITYLLGVRAMCTWFEDGNPKCGLKAKSMFFGGLTLLAETCAETTAQHGEAPDLSDDNGQGSAADS